MPPKSTPESFWAKFEETFPNRCWLWPGATHGRGHGLVSWQGRLRTAHHVAYELARGRSVPAGSAVPQTCGHVLCCNPNHLGEPITRQDAMAKARAAAQGTEAAAKRKATKAEQRAVTIDLETYRRLEARVKGAESVADVIRRLAGSK